MKRSNQSLRIVLRSCRVASTTAQQNFVDAISAEIAASAEEANLSNSIQIEISAAGSIFAPDAVVDSLGAWLPIANAKRNAAREKAEAAAANTQLARTLLTLARTEEGVVEALIEKRDEFERKRLLANEQRANDEASSKAMRKA